MGHKTLSCNLYGSYCIPWHIACVYQHCVQTALKTMEEECTHAQMMYQSSQEELEQLVERSDEHVQEIRELNEKFHVCFSAHTATHYYLSVDYMQKC